MVFRTSLGLILAASFLGAGQGGTALSGRISDGTAPVINAIVTISNREFLKSVTSDGSGFFALESIPPGRYDFRTTAPGFAIFESSVVVHPDDSRKNWMEIKKLVPADQQVISVADFYPRKQARN
jgi:hypothetical protein